MITKQIQILIKEDTKFGVLNDALYFSEEEYAKMSEEDVQAKVKERVDNYESTIQAIKDTPPKQETDEELVARKESIISEKERLDFELQNVETKLSDKVKPK